MLWDKTLNFLTGIPFFLLILPKSRIGGIIALCLWLCLCFILPPRKDTEEDHLFAEAVFGLLLSVIFGVMFCFRWQNSERIASLSGTIGLPAKQLCAVIAVLLCFGSLFFIRRCTGLFRETLFRHIPSCAAELVFIALTAALVITLVSKCSPLYPCQDWVDPNTMFSLGRGMLKGLVPYRDLYEQKGPVILGMHALGALISFDDFRGIWLLEIAECFFFLLLLYRTARLFFGRRALLIVPLLALMTYISHSFAEGDSTEEFCLPLLDFALYMGIKAVELKRLPSNSEGVWIGIAAGCIFWSKYSMMGFYAGWFLYFLIHSIRSEKLPEFGRLLLSVLAGGITVSIPVIVYFAANHALGSLWEVYFYNNMHYYTVLEEFSGPVRILLNYRSGLIRMWDSHPVMLVLSAAGLLWCAARKHIRSGLFLMLTMVSGFAVIFWGGVSFPYYVFIFSFFSVLGAMWLFEIPALTRVNAALPAVCVFYICMVCILLLGPNIYLLRFEPSDFPQYQVKNVIENSGIGDPVILHYGFLDAGFNLAAGLVPRQRFFCFYNLDLPEMKAEQQRYIDDAEADFVLTCHMPLEPSDNYEFIGSWPGDFKPNGNSSRFFLYQKVSAEP